MNVVNLITGESHEFNLTESAEDFFNALFALSSDGGNLRFSMDYSERLLFENRFEGEHVAQFVHELRSRAKTDDSLTYREEDDAGLYVFTTYRKPD